MDPIVQVESIIYVRSRCRWIPCDHLTQRYPPVKSLSYKMPIKTLVASRSMKTFKTNSHKSPIGKYIEKTHNKLQRQPLKSVQNYKSESRKKLESTNKLYGQYDSESTNWNMLTKQAESKIYEQPPSISTPKAAKELVFSKIEVHSPSFSNILDQFRVQGTPKAAEDRKEQFNYKEQMERIYNGCFKIYR